MFRNTTHDAVLQLVDRLRGQDFSLRIYAGKRIHLHAAEFSSPTRKTTPYRKCLRILLHQQNEIYIFVILKISFPVTTDWKPYYTRCLHLLTERYFFPGIQLCISYSHPERPGIFRGTLEKCGSTLLQFCTPRTAKICWNIWKHCSFPSVRRKTVSIFPL